MQSYIPGRWNRSPVFRGRFRRGLWRSLLFNANFARLLESQLLFKHYSRASNLVRDGPMSCMSVMACWIVRPCLKAKSQAYSRRQNRYRTANSLLVSECLPQKYVQDKRRSLLRKFLAGMQILAVYDRSENIWRLATDPVKRNAFAQPADEYRKMARDLEALIASGNIPGDLGI